MVTADRIALTGEARAASEGTVLAEQIENRPLLRTGELLEVVPGLIVTQHTGDGKANQYFLRGFNLDHGTDFSTTVDGVPANMPTHAHGQGYMDINFVIPELVDRIMYRKGTYYADLGNFSAAGTAEINYRSEMRPFAAVTLGPHDYLRTVAGGSVKAFGGNLLLGGELGKADGPWNVPEDLHKSNVLARWSRDGIDSDLAVEFSAYQSRWQATDQIPQRAVDGGLIGRYGSLDPTSGGDTHRYALSAKGGNDFSAGRLDYTIYGIDYGMQLYSNFTYAMEDPLRGDQFEQYDDRHVYGGSAKWEQPLTIGEREFLWRAGIDTRNDDISPVGLYLTEKRVRYETVREDHVNQWMTGIWTSLSTQVTSWMRAEVGARADRYDFDVKSDNPLNSGKDNASIANPKLALSFGPWADTEFFAAAGGGFHSNDARGGVISVDPSDGVTPVERVTPLARARGYEIGMRSALIPFSQVSLSLWQLDLASELLFVGDGGTTEPSRPTRRRGVELGVYARPMQWLIIDADYAWSKARFRDDDDAGNYVPGALVDTASLGVTANAAHGWFSAARLRHLGAAPLIEDNSVRSSASTMVNLDVGRHITEHWTVTLSLFNVFDTKANDIAYYYESQLPAIGAAPAEAAPVEDIHFHPVEPRTLRATVRYDF
ncbi:MAG: TonB-dependent receptor [Chromatiales bacterium]|nr:TonB-dependent receptor [Chromatiales bacterium]